MRQLATNEYAMLGLAFHLTQRGNAQHTRYGWLRLTPAYSVHAVTDLLNRYALADDVVLDPFCGSGTTAVACAERGLACISTDINPFLVWLAQTKTRIYLPAEVEQFRQIAAEIIQYVETIPHDAIWLPAIHQREKWWDTEVLHLLGALWYQIQQLRQQISESIHDLLKIAFCRVVILHSHASFSHQSMSFKKARQPGLFARTLDDLGLTWQASVNDIAHSLQTPIIASPAIHLHDARQLSTLIPHDSISLVITSPPYPNRMSYIRELRPYMYWLGYLNNGRDAGELDWQAIGGTWGIATSYIGRWPIPDDHGVVYPHFAELIQRIAQHSDLLARYVAKYVVDMRQHIAELYQVTRHHARIFYIVGNSTFYNVLVPTEQILASLLQAAGFSQIDITPLRKRTSKKELYEYIVSAKKV